LSGFFFPDPTSSCSGSSLLPSSVSDGVGGGSQKHSSSGALHSGMHLWYFFFVQSISPQGKPPYWTA